MNENNPKLLVVNEPEEKFSLNLQAKKTKLTKKFDELYEHLNSLTIQKNEINIQEEAIQVELSGLNGALTVLDELIEETKIHSDMDV